MGDPVLFDLQDGVLTATFNEPDTMNALSPGITKGLFELFDHTRDDAVRVVLLTGSGRGFCAGAMAKGGGPGGGPSNRTARLDQKGRSAQSVEAFSQCDKPIVAAVNGAAVGAGFGIALSCDVRILGESARMSSIFIKRGLASDFGVAYWLPRIVGVGRAYEIMYSGELLDAQRCLELGIANRVVADADLLAEAGAFARMIADGPPLAYTVLRRMIQRSMDMDQGEFAEYEWTNQKLLVASKDRAEGFRAFAEKRAPQFTGE